MLVSGGRPCNCTIVRQCLGFWRVRAIKQRRIRQPGCTGSIFFTHADPDSDSHPYGYDQSYANINADAASDAFANAYIHRLYSHSHPHADANANNDRLPNAHRKPGAERQPDAPGVDLSLRGILRSGCQSMFIFRAVPDDWPRRQPCNRTRYDDFYLSRPIQ